MRNAQSVKFLKCLASPGDGTIQTRFVVEKHTIRLLPTLNFIMICEGDEYGPQMLQIRSNLLFVSQQGQKCID